MCYSIVWLHQHVCSFQYSWAIWDSLHARLWLETEVTNALDKSLAACACISTDSNLLSVSICLVWLTIPSSRSQYSPIRSLNNFPLLFLFLCCLWMCVHVHVCTHACVHGEASEQCHMFSFVILHLLFMTQSFLVNMELASSARLSGQQPQRPPHCISPVLQLQVYGHTFLQPIIFFSALVLGIKSRSSCLYNKHFTVWAVPSVLPFCLTVPILQRCVTEVSHYGYLCPCHVNEREQFLKDHWLFGCSPSFMGFSVSCSTSCLSLRTYEFFTCCDYALQLSPTS